MPRAHAGRRMMVEHQATATLNQANPVSGTQYEVLAATENCRIVSIVVAVTWTVQPTPLQIWIVIDGQTLEGYQFNPVSDQDYVWAWDYVDLDNARFNLNAVGGSRDKAFVIEGRSVQVLVETTGGTVQNIRARVEYAIIP